MPMRHTCQPSPPPPTYKLRVGKSWKVFAAGPEFLPSSDPVFRGGSDVAEASQVDAVGFEHAARDHTFVHLVGTVIDAGRTFVAVPESQRRVIGHAERAVDLDGPVQDPLEHTRDVELDERDIFAEFVLPVDLPGGLEDHQARRFDLRPRLRDPLLNLSL